MKELKRMITAAVMLGILTTGAFAQGQNKDDQRRPPKEAEKVKEKEREQRPPNRDQHQDRGNDNKRGRP
ncbi:MAG: hypothetical protein WBP93_06285 [Pyrinomonadaceae bacterium]